MLLLSHFSRVRLCATHRRQPTRLRRPWDSAGKNTGVDCHFSNAWKWKVKVKSDIWHLLKRSPLLPPWKGQGKQKHLFCLYQSSHVQIYLVVVQSLSVFNFLCCRTTACQTALSFTISWSLLKLMFIESMIPSNRLILCCPLLLLPSIFPRIRVFSMSQFFASGGQSIGVSASTSVLPMYIQDWFLLGWSG